MSSPSIHNSKSKSNLIAISENLVSNPSSATKVPAKSVEKNPTRKHQSENLTQVDPIKIDSDDVKEV